MKEGVFRSQNNAYYKLPPNLEPFPVKTRMNDTDYGPTAPTGPRMVRGSRTPSFIGWKHQPQPINHVHIGNINNNDTRKLHEVR